MVSTSHGYTFAEKALARAAGLSSVVAGQIVDGRPDVAMSHDNTADIYKTFKKLGVSKVKYPDRWQLRWITPYPHRRRNMLRIMRKFASLSGNRALPRFSRSEGEFVIKFTVRKV